MKVFKQQLRKLNNPSNIDDKEDVLESERKLQQLNYVEYVENLSQDVQDSLRNIQYRTSLLGVLCGKVIR